MGTTKVRGVLALQRTELIGRWQRQLQAASEAGFALDSATAQVLPELLEATDRALERRFRVVPSGTPSLCAQARGAAMQCSLLGDFLFDAVLESCPELTTAGQRLLGGALAHAAVEVLVRRALQKEREKRRREVQKAAKLAHDLLYEGGLRLSRVQLGAVLADAHLAAGELGAHDKRLTVLLDKPASPLLVQADLRIVRPAIRGLLRAAVQLARQGTTIHFGAAAGRNRARVAISVLSCRKLPGNRVPDLPALGFARRAARAHGGSLSTRRSAPDGCELRFDLPSPKRN